MRPTGIRRDGEAARARAGCPRRILKRPTKRVHPGTMASSDLAGENIDYFVGNTLSIVLDSLCDQIQSRRAVRGDELLPGMIAAAGRPIAIRAACLAPAGPVRGF